MLKVTGDFPYSEVEVVNRDVKIIVEWRSLEGKHWSVVSLSLVGKLDILGNLLLVVSSLRLHTPINQ